MYYNYVCSTYSAYNERTRAYKNASFDIVFDHEASQGKVFADCGVPNLVKQVVEVSLFVIVVNDGRHVFVEKGYNSTIFAYGQTGSGKTFTMEGYKYQTSDKGVPTAVVE